MLWVLIVWPKILMVFIWLLFRSLLHFFRGHKIGPSLAWVCTVILCTRIFYWIGCSDAPGFSWLFVFQLSLSLLDVCLFVTLYFYSLSVVFLREVFLACVFICLHILFDSYWLVAHYPSYLGASICTCLWPGFCWNCPCYPHLVFVGVVHTTKLGIVGWYGFHKFPP